MTRLIQLSEGDVRRVALVKEPRVARAFARELVPQDPTDEPAERLLVRIKEQNRK